MSRVLLAAAALSNLIARNPELLREVRVDPAADKLPEPPTHTSTLPPPHPGQAEAEKRRALRAARWAREARNGGWKSK